MSSGGYLSLTWELLIIGPIIKSSQVRLRLEIFRRKTSEKLRTILNSQKFLRKTSRPIIQNHLSEMPTSNNTVRQCCH